MGAGVGWGPPAGPAGRVLALSSKKAGSGVSFAGGGWGSRRGWPPDADDGL